MEHSTNSNVAHLIELRVHRTIQSYLGNLLCVSAAIDAGWVPNGDEPGIVEHLLSLKEYLAATGRSGADDFLLRFALTVPGTQRGVVPPVQALELNGNGFSDRRKRESAGQIDRLNEVLCLARRFLAGLSLDTSSALRQLAEIASAPVDTGSSDWLGQIQSLSTQESDKVAEIAINCLESTASPVHELGIDLLESLACFRFEPLGAGICHSLRSKGIFWVASLFRDEGDSEAKALLRLLEGATDLGTINALLLCVVWTRSQVAVQSFRDWSQYPPSWASLLHVPPSDYPPSAGWCLNAKGERHDLISMNCFRLRPADAAAPDVIPCLVPNQQSCPGCKLPAVALFDFTTFHSKLPESAPVKIYCCLYCSTFAPIFVQYFLNHSWEWIAPEAASPRTSDFNVMPRYVAPDKIKCPPFASEKVFELDDATLIGGAPMWLQDAEYPYCPACKVRMTFLAQHDNSAVQNEGIYYAFFCPDCQISAVNYQQT